MAHVCFLFRRGTLGDKHPQVGRLLLVCCRLRSLLFEHRHCQTKSPHNFGSIIAVLLCVRCVYRSALALLRPAFGHTGTSRFGTTLPADRNDSDSGTNQRMRAVSDSSRHHRRSEFESVHRRLIEPALSHVTSRASDSALMPSRHLLTGPRSQIRGGLLGGVPAHRGAAAVELAGHRHGVRGRLQLGRHRAAPPGAWVSVRWAAASGCMLTRARRHGHGIAGIALPGAAAWAGGRGHRGTRSAPKALAQPCPATRGVIVRLGGVGRPRPTRAWPAR